MAVEIQSLEPTIREILTAPGTDLSTISAKRVRKQLLEQDSSLTSDFVKENKENIDELITTVFEQVSAAAGQAEEEEDVKRDNGKGKRRRAAEAYSDEEADEGEEEVESETPPPKAKKGRKNEITDEELARQLAREINGRSRSSRASSTRGRGRGGGKRGGKRGAKSAATVDSDGEGEEGEVKKRHGGGFKKEYMLSEPLAAVINVEKLSRPQVVKQLWDYIKGNSLQNPENKREIMCDDKLKAVFKVEKIDMFKMNKVLGLHLSKLEAES